MAKRYGIAIDTRLCCGCNSCVVACKMENNLPEGNFWNRALTEGGESIDTYAGTYGTGSKRYLTVSCQHCENPACTRVCPVSATYKDAETGVVHQDYDKCIGCRMCMAACPYTGVRQFNWEEPHYPLGISTGAAEVVPHQKHVVEKCTMCDHRLAVGEDPLCVATCPAYARFFGDLNDPSSEIARLIASRRYKQLLPERGTRPSVYYLV
ncbi:MAG: 4Fe-4S dicluster domain-containing protein [Coriobacteriaceae bacterium]|jgi:molybdopterin-containing oxidoreductase family iron-sulfur binding subunit|nr:4Fe-4S dicluster domain-containing protein [Coriobacteriaceae bacterium]